MISKILSFMLAALVFSGAALAQGIGLANPLGPGQYEPVYAVSAPAAPSASASSASFASSYSGYSYSGSSYPTTGHMPGYSFPSWFGAYYYYSYFAPEYAYQFGNPHLTGYGYSYGQGSRSCLYYDYNCGSYAAPVGPTYTADAVANTQPTQVSVIKALAPTANWRRTTIGATASSGFSATPAPAAAPVPGQVAVSPAPVTGPRMPLYDLGSSSAGNANSVVSDYRYSITGPSLASANAYSTPAYVGPVASVTYQALVPTARLG